MAMDTAALKDYCNAFAEEFFVRVRDGGRSTNCRTEDGARENHVVIRARPRQFYGIVHR
jgi:hypothetical protein